MQLRYKYRLTSRHRFVWFTTLLLLIGVPWQATALTTAMPHAKKLQARPWVKSENWRSLRSHAFEADESFSLVEKRRRRIWLNLRKGQVSFADAVADLVHSELPYRGLSLKRVSLPPPLLNLTSNKPYEQVIYRFVVDGVDLCEGEVKGHYRAGMPPMVFGLLPLLQNEPIPIEPKHWPNLDKAKIVAKNASFAGISSHTERSLDRCYHIEGGALVAAWSFIRKDSQGLSYRLIADEKKLYEVQPLFFDLAEGTTARIQAYDSNPVDGELQVYTTKLEGDGTLTSEFFQAFPNANPDVSVEQAFSENHDFIYEPDDSRFAEASSFIHGIHMYEYFQSLGYNWHSSKPLSIRLHVVLNNTKNNALYEPDRDGRPAISLGDGDGVGLRNLPLDADVVSHEFAHHVIYRTLKSTTGESLILHEGLADFFTFSRTEDTCLGESICPLDSNYCVIKNKCLRTADNDLMYESDAYNSVGAHLKGQLISGLLWDLRSQMEASHLTSVVFLAIDYLAPSSGILDLVIAMLHADKELSGAEYSCTIFDAATNRGLSKVLSGVDCTKEVTWQIQASAAAGQEEEPPPAASSSKKKDRGIFGCGALAANGPSQGPGSPLFILILLAPMLFAIRPILTTPNKKSPKGNH